MPDRSQAASGIIIVKDRRGVTPASAFDADLLSVHPVGAQFEMKPLKHRSLPQQRLYWQMLSKAVEACALGDKDPTAPKLHDAMLRELGYVTVTYELGTGKPYITRDSTAFDKMTADEFKGYFDRASAKLSEITGVDALAFADPLPAPVETERI